MPFSPRSTYWRNARNTEAQASDGWHGRRTLGFVEHRIGYVAKCLTLGIGAGHTTRLGNASPGRLAALIAQNLEELEQILLFNERERIGVFRIGSSLVPFASHPINRLRWWKTFARDFAAIGRIAARSRQRLSLHPSPAAASVSSARSVVRRAALRELVYATRVLDLLGQGPDARVVIHVGGAKPTRARALAAAHRFLERLPDDVLRRLALEHDCRIWTAREVAPLATAHALPFIADSLHHEVLPSDPPMSLRDTFALAESSWEALGLRPKHHVASQRRHGPPGAHADRIRPRDWQTVLDALNAPADLMVEAKDKDLALFALRRRFGTDTR